MSTPPRRSIKWLGRFTAMCFGLSLAWLIAEIALRVFYFTLPTPMQEVLRNVHQTPFTDETILPPPVWQPDIDYLQINRPVTNYVHYGSPQVKFTVNTETLWGSRVGFRTTQSQVDHYVDGVAIGDSFTFCFTDEEDCWIQILSRQSQHNFINMGIVGTGSSSHLRILQDFGQPLKPSVVLWQWFGNDANEDYGLAYLRGETDIVSTVAPTGDFDLSWWERNSAVYSLLDLLLSKDAEFEATLWKVDRYCDQAGSLHLCFGQPYLWGAFDMKSPQNSYGQKRSESAILSARDLTQTWGGQFVVVVMPPKELVYQEMAEPLVGREHITLLKENYQTMQTFCTAEALTCLDLLTVFREYAAQGKQIYYTDDIHLNPLGNQVLADYLNTWLAETETNGSQVNLP
jgi:hypothetical protein